MPDPLTVTPAELAAAAATTGRVARLLAGAMHAAGDAIEFADVAAGDWLAVAAAHRVARLALHRLAAIAHDLATTSAALADAVTAYQAADDRAARRYPTGRFASAVARPRVTPW